MRVVASVRSETRASSSGGSLSSVRKNQLPPQATSPVTRPRPGTSTETSRAWQKLGTFRGDSAFGTWLHRLAVNVVIERFRTEATHRQRLHDGEGIFETLPAPARSGDMAMDFDSALTRLPDGAREIFVLHDVEGYKHHEIATMLEISAGTSKAQLHRARMMLRRHLTARVPAPLPDAAGE